LKTIKNFPFELPVSDDSGRIPHFRNCNFIDVQIIFHSDKAIVIKLKTKNSTLLNQFQNSIGKP
jgi:hypothetical protein